MTNFYEILEVSEKASKEVIDKAYRVLAKKYHPDVQTNQKREEAEKKMKQINEAYEILSDEEKRKQYDSQLAQQRQIEWQQQREAQANEIREEETFKKSVYEQEIKEQETTSKEAAKEITEQMQRAYAQAYNDYWRSRGYRIKEKWTWKRTKDLLKVLGILAIIILVIWFFPPTHNMLVSFYQDNAIVKVLVDVFVNIVTGIGNGIYQFVIGIFNK